MIKNDPLLEAVDVATVSFWWKCFIFFLHTEKKGCVIPTKSFVKIGIAKIFCYNNKMFGSMNKTFGCCGKISGCSNKNFICCP